MLDGTLATTNLLLAILTLVSVGAAIAFVVALITLVRLAREVSHLVSDLRQQLSTLSERVDGVGESLERTIADVQTHEARDDERRTGAIRVRHR